MGGQPSARSGFDRDGIGGGLGSEEVAVALVILFFFVLAVVLDETGEILFGQAGEQVIDQIDIEGLRIEILPQPVEHFLVFRVIGIGEDLNEVVVSGRAAAIFRGAGAFAVDDDEEIVLGGELSEQCDLVFPAIAEVVIKNDRGNILLEEVFDEELLLVQVGLVITLVEV